MKSMKKISYPSRIFDTINILFLLLLVLTMVIPFLNTLALAFSSNFASMQPGIVLWPKEFSVEGFSTVWSRMKLYLPFTNNVIVTVVGTVCHVFLSSMAGYVLIQRGLPGKKWMLSAILLTMMIPSEAIMIPLYIVNKDLGLLNTLSSLILSGFVSGFSVMLMRNFFLSVPYEMSESARIDGAGDYRIFFTMYLPLARAGLATVTLFEFVSRWNQFTPAVLYINDSSKYTLQIALKSLIVDNDATSSNFMITTNVRMAGIVIALLPLIIIYPYVQKYFVKGMFVGANKE
ncbi:carbohydrate ABC transporter permease [Paenibacillus glucanolyticus]|jgi:putative aldouronate transport system permease protein|uniref:ABC transporter permease n=1 Tax=Paenibacillus glucanolyticus TaxID=59843 RepID=A0A163DGD3_9BACL|nr:MULTISPECIES: carbohydrate ABC transporter permease [Paenibacillus]MCA4752351.1 carbohydrate ABC transporter permease [Mycolicibacterium fortuitum]AVV58267.1 carbohydrate ABC transporter permease [Paenibacillus glucanolyticus]AWP27431.1 ABC transporter permease [Paenibacillus sp. Cedars]ETT42478.1 binding-protein-dependent transport systems inner membrane component [Paenibacillus sp. FSL R5-808]KZS43204.1 ABC transporter permease [Paenibacillus glucanolyticus]